MATTLPRTHGETGKPLHTPDGPWGPRNHRWPPEARRSRPASAAHTRGPRGGFGDRAAAGGPHERRAPRTTGPGDRVHVHRTWHTPGAASASPVAGSTRPCGGSAPTSPGGGPRGGLRGAQGADRSRRSPADEPDVSHVVAGAGVDGVHGGPVGEPPQPGACGRCLTQARGAQRRVSGDGLRDRLLGQHHRRIATVSTSAGGGGRRAGRHGLESARQTDACWSHRHATLSSLNAWPE